MININSYAITCQMYQLRRFALAFIHSHSGATGVFRNAFMRKVAEATSCLPKTLQTT